MGGWGSRGGAEWLRLTSLLGNQATASSFVGSDHVRSDSCRALSETYGELHRHRYLIAEASFDGFNCIGQGRSRGNRSPGPRWEISELEPDSSRLLVDGCLR